MKNLQHFVDDDLKTEFQNKQGIFAAHLEYQKAPTKSQPYLMNKHPYLYIPQIFNLTHFCFLSYFIHMRR